MKSVGEEVLRSGGVVGCTTCWSCAAKAAMSTSLFPAFEDTLVAELDCRVKPGYETFDCSVVLRDAGVGVRVEIAGKIRHCERTGVTGDS